MDYLHEAGDALDEARAELQARKQKPRTPDAPAPANLLEASAPGRYYGSITLSEVPEDALSERDAPALARIIYVGSYIALWQFISQFSPSLPLADQSRIIRVAFAYIKHIESLKLEPLKLATEELEGPLVEQTARLRARLLEVVREVRRVAPAAPLDDPDPVTTQLAADSEPHQAPRSTHRSTTRPTPRSKK